jgi:riboflavin biosynthesis pyrimidine reductase
VRLTTLFESETLPAHALPEELSSTYDGNLALQDGTVYANFVTTLDGVTALGDGSPPSVIGGGSEADRFVMGLLRAWAGAVVIGAGTMNAEPNHLWTPEHVYPPMGGAYERLRRSLGLPSSPQLVVLSRSGNVATGAVSFERGAVLLTTTSGAASIRRKLPSATSVRTVMSDRIDPKEVVALLRRDGHRTILTEGGPRVFGSFLRSRAVDELFLTLSPRIAGRSRAVPRLGLVEDMALGSKELLEANLLSAKREGSHLFLRYHLIRAAG